MISTETPDLFSMTPFVLKILNERCNFYDILNTKLNSPKEFNDIHKTLLKYNWSKWVYNYKTNDDKTGEVKYVELVKKRIEKNQKIFIMSRLDLIKKYIIIPVWEPIQFCLGLNIVNYYDRCVPNSKK